MINITLESLLNSADALHSLSEKPLKARSAYTIAKILKQAENEVAEFNESRMALLNRYGDKDEHGELITTDDGSVHVRGEALNEFNKEMRDLLNSAVEISGNKIQLEDLNDVQFTPAEMAQLEAFIEIGE